MITSIIKIIYFSFFLRTKKQRHFNASALLITLKLRMLITLLRMLLRFLPLRGLVDIQMPQAMLSRPRPLR